MQKFCHQEIILCFLIVFMYNFMQTYYLCVYIQFALCRYTIYILYYIYVIYICINLIQIYYTCVYMYMLYMVYMQIYMIYVGFLIGSDGKESACNAGDLGLILESGRSLGGGNGDSLRYSCLENSMARAAWWGHSMGSQSQTQLSN